MSRGLPGYLAVYKPSSAAAENASPRYINAFCFTEEREERGGRGVVHSDYSSKEEWLLVLDRLTRRDPIFLVTLSLHY